MEEVFPEGVPVKPARPWRKWLVWAGCVVLGLLIAGELFARYGLGLGDPPLYIADPDIEYLNKPSMQYRRFGHRVSYNEYSMRNSGPVTPRKADPSELRVLVVGDSVVNGGAQLDDSLIATTLLQQRLSKALDRPVFVGNISAGSWGPPNELAYLHHFGWFDADAVVFIFNSEDYGDVPSNESMVGKVVELPDHPPVSALMEGITRYLIPRFFTGPVPNLPLNQRVAPKPENISQALSAITQMVRETRERGTKKIIAAQILDVAEYGSDHPEWAGHAAIGATLREAGIEPLQFAPAFTKAMSNSQNPYLDNVHPSAIGHAIIADLLFEPLREALVAKASSQPTSASSFSHN